MTRMFPLVTVIVLFSTTLLLPDILSRPVAIAQPQAQLEQLAQDAEAAFVAGDFARAEETWRRVLQLYPDNADANLRLGEVLERQGRVTAEQYFREAIRLSPDNAYAHYRLASFLSWYGRYEEAEPLFLLAIQLNPSDFRPYFVPMMD